MRKGDLQIRLLRYLYLNDARTEFDPQAIQAFAEATAGANATVNAAVASAAASAALYTHAHGTARNGFPVAAAASSLQFPSYHQQFTHPQQPSAAAATSLSAVASLTHRPYIKNEHSLPSDDLPRNENEKQIMASLLQMGFTHKSEIMSSIRKLSSSQVGPLKTDSVMMDMIQAREEAEEAKKMDEARRQSEVTRKRESQARRLLLEQQLQERLEQASVAEWKQDKNMFLHSWILQQEGMTEKLQAAIQKYSPIKARLMELLKLEKQARKWFMIMPKAYFVGVLGAELQERVQLPAADLCTWLVERVELLQRAIYTLSEQTPTGVPVIFVHAHDEWTLRNSNSLTDGNGNTDSDDDDVCIIVLPTVSTTTSPEAAVQEAKPITTIDIMDTTTTTDETTTTTTPTETTVTTTETTSTLTLMETSPTKEEVTTVAAPMYATTTSEESSSCTSTACAPAPASTKALPAADSISDSTNSVNSVRKNNSDSGTASHRSYDNISSNKRPANPDNNLVISLCSSDSSEEPFRAPPRPLAAAPATHDIIVILD